VAQAVAEGRGVIFFGSEQDLATLWSAFTSAGGLMPRSPTGYLGGSDYFPPLVCPECLKRSGERPKLPWRGSVAAVRKACAAYGIDLDALPAGDERDAAYQKMADAIEAAATQDGAVW
jgi:hypothetical protein